jgi:hypothetical protein
VSPSFEPRDCPLCRSAGSIYAGFCQVCLSNVDGMQARSLVRSAKPQEPSQVEPPRRSDPIRFSEVVEEIRTIARVAAEAGSHEGPVGDACRRAEVLLERLRSQFLSDVALGTHQPASVP